MMVTTGARGLRSSGLSSTSSSTFFDRRMDHAAAALAFFDLEAEAVFGANLLGDALVNGLVDVGEDA